jgi:hypothetical protein
MKRVKRLALASWMVIGTALLISHGVVAPAKAHERPAVLVHSPRGQGSVAGVDVEFLKELKAAGLEVDYTDRHAEFTWDRIRKHNVLILYTCPGPEGSPYQNFLTRPNAPHQKEFVELVQRFLAEGGGVFLMAYTHNVDSQHAKPLTDNWNADLPLQWIEETDESKIGHLTRIRHSRLAFTDQVFDSPVSEGVRQLWHPYGKHYLAGATGPLVLGPKWTVVVRASKTSRTVPIATEGAGYNPPANVTKIFPTVESPPIFAVRDYKKGRVALCSMRPVFTFTSGKQWLFHSDVLTEGFGCRAVELCQKPQPQHDREEQEPRTDLAELCARCSRESPACGRLYHESGRLQPPDHPQRCTVRRRSTLLRVSWLEQRQQEQPNGDGKQDGCADTVKHTSPACQQIAETGGTAPSLEKEHRRIQSRFLRYPKQPVSVSSVQS